MVSLNKGQSVTTWLDIYRDLFKHAQPIPLVQF